MANLTDFTFAVELATGSTPRTASPTYTAITSYVMAGDTISLSRGRSSEQVSTAQAGRANVTLRNTDNRFTMGNGSSPYAPLQLRRPCRFRVTYSGTTYDRWQGFVDDWGNARDGTTGIARLSLSDRLARVGRITLPSTLAAEIRYDNPTRYWPMDDVAATPVTCTERSGNGGQPLAASVSGASSVLAGTTDFAIPDAGRGFAFFPQNVGVDPNNWATLLSPEVPTYTTGSTVECIFRIDEQQDVTFGNTDIVRGNFGRIRIEGAGANYLTAYTATASASVSAPSVLLTVGATYHVAYTQSVSGATVTHTLYLNGVSIASSTYAGTSIAGGSGTLAPAVGQYLNNAAVGHFAIYSTALSAGRIAERAAGLNSWSPELTTDRFNRLCRVAGLPSAAYAVTGTSVKYMAGQPATGGALLDLLDQCATVEGGVLFVSDTGVLTLSTSDVRYNTAVGLTLDSTKAGQVVSDVELTTNDGLLINDSTATRDGGGVQRTVDATSVTNYDTHDESVTLYCNDDYIALNWTQWRVGSYKTPAPRLESVTVNVVGYANSGGVVADLLNADIGTKLQITNLPADVSSSGTLSLLVEGVRDEWTKDAYRITFTTSPIGLNDSVWKLGTSLLGVGTTLGY